MMYEAEREDKGPWQALPSDHEDERGNDVGDCPLGSSHSPKEDCPSSPSSASDSEEMDALPTAVGTEDEVISVYDEYYFPKIPPELESYFAGLTDEELVAALGSCHEAGLDDYTTWNALTCRSKLIAIHFEMNRRGRLAPGYRLHIPGTKPTAEPTLFELMAMRDRQLIDLHWLYEGCGVRCYLDDGRFNSIFAKRGFRVNEAIAFAMTPCSIDEKVDQILWLTRAQQAELSILQTQEMRSLVRDVRKGRTYGGKKRTTTSMYDIRRIIQTAAERNKAYAGVVDEWTALWACRQIIGCEGEPLRRFYAVATGRKVLAPSTLRAKLKRLDALLKSAKR